VDAQLEPDAVGRHGRFFLWLSSNCGINSMALTCVVGLQWGDEAKGKIVDLLTRHHDLVVRYNGGPNAGHTVVRDGKTFKLSLVPSGILDPSKISVVGNGVVMNPARFLGEISKLREAGVAVAENLVLSNHAHVIFPYHEEEERLSEAGSGRAIGTTGRGIGPCYQEKIGRSFGIRLGELLHRDVLREKLGMIVARKNKQLAALAADAKQFNADALTEEYVGYGEQLRPHIRDTFHYLQRALRDGKRMIFEGAQGCLLDIDHGTYPYVTSSNSTPGGIWNGCGIPARNLDKVIGVIKAYISRVGKGPFPTELDDGPTGMGERIRKRGREYGTVTGRPRRCGWLDAVCTRYSARLSGVDELAVMLLDVLSEPDEIKLCTAYELDGERTDEFPSDGYLLERCKPVYETLPGWKVDISGARRLTDLPAAARRYVDRISELMELPVSFVSIGPDREQTIVV